MAKKRGHAENSNDPTELGLTSRSERISTQRHPGRGREGQGEELLPSEREGWLL